MKSMKKRLLLVITAAVLAVSIVLGACVTKPSNQSSNSGSANAESDVASDDYQGLDDGRSSQGRGPDPTKGSSNSSGERR